MGFLRALGFGSKRSHAPPRAHLPPLGAMIEMSFTRSGGPVSVCFETLGSTSFEVTAQRGVVAGTIATFTYGNSVGKFRFAATCLAPGEDFATFALPSRIETIQVYGGGAEQRASKRLEATVIAYWRHAHAGKGTGEFTRASLTDISRSGASLIVEREMRQGTQVEVRFTLNSGSAPLTLVGEVMRLSKLGVSTKHSLGLKFLEPSEADVRAITEFINKRQAERRSRGLA
jgi:hypothetical protein